MDFCAYHPTKSSVSAERASPLKHELHVKGDAEHRSLFDANPPADMIDVGHKGRVVFLLLVDIGGGDEEPSHITLVEDIFSDLRGADVVLGLMGERGARSKFKVR